MQARKLKYSDEKNEQHESASAVTIFFSSLHEPNFGMKWEIEFCMKCPEVIIPDDDLIPTPPSELDIASVVYGPELPRSPLQNSWVNHGKWVAMRAVYISDIDKVAEVAQTVSTMLSTRGSASGNAPDCSSDAHT